MVITCVQCGGKLTVTGDQLGKGVVCPHCRQTIRLPAAAAAAVPDASAESVEGQWRDWLTGWVPPLVSLVVHMLLLIIFAYISWGTGLDQEMGEEVLIGELPALDLSSQDDESLEMLSQDAVSEPSADETLDVPEVAPPVTADGEATGEEVSIALLAPSTSGGGSAFDLGAVNLGGGGSGGGGWEGMLRRLRRNGLDIVIVFDSTSSMAGEIAQVKAQIYRIGTALHRLVPKTRISLCTYRDTGDAYVVKGTPLTKDLGPIETFLAGVKPGGGGDTEEAVQAGLQWAVQNNDFRAPARKVILLFGDAPPHRQDLAACVRTAADFHDQQNGVVSAVTCRSPRSLPEFVEIAEAGGGEAFLTADERQIMTQLMVLVFGSRYRSKVVEALQLMR